MKTAYIMVKNLVFDTNEMSELVLFSKALTFEIYYLEVSSAYFDT